MPNLAPWLKLYYKVILIKAVWYWHKNKPHRPVEQNWEPRNKPMHICQLIFDKGSKNMAPTHKGLLAIKNEILPFSTLWWNLGHHAKWNKSEKDKYNLISLICGIQNIALIKTEIEWWLPGTKGCGKGEDAGQRVETGTSKMNKFQGGLPKWC